MSPHPPFVWDEEGRSVDWHGQYLVADGPAFMNCHDGNRTLYREKYRKQLQYLNKRLLAMVDDILANGQRQSVIILQGDHGPRSEINFHEPEQTNLTEAFGIFNAIRLPQDKMASPRSANLYASLTPVNTFRVVLNHCFATNLQLLPDLSYFETNPYEFVDVTPGASVAETENPNRHIPWHPTLQAGVSR